VHKARGWSRSRCERKRCAKKTATLRWLYKVLGRTSLGDLKSVRRVTA
jgi:hypothetical protein